MHAKYSFLLTLDDKDADQKDLLEDAIGQFEHWASSHCDDNNWSQPLVLITKKGQILQACEGGDWRGRDEVYADVVERAGDKPFDWAMRFALNCVVNELRCFDIPWMSLGEPKEDEKKEQERLDSLSFEKLVEEIHHNCTKQLALAYRDLHNGKPAKDTLDDWKRRTLARSYEIFRGADRKPFSDNGTPYEYRAFDLTKYQGSDEDEAILIVDIHT